MKIALRILSVCIFITFVEWIQCSNVFAISFEPVHKGNTLSGGDFRFTGNFQPITRFGSDTLSHALSSSLQPLQASKKVTTQTKSHSASSSQAQSKASSPRSLPFAIPPSSHTLSATRQKSSLSNSNSLSPSTGIPLHAQQISSITAKKSSSAAANFSKPFHSSTGQGASPTNETSSIHDTNTSNAILSRTNGDISSAPNLTSPSNSRSSLSLQQKTEAMISSSLTNVFSSLANMSSQFTQSVFQASKNGVVKMAHTLPSAASSTGKALSGFSNIVILGFMGRLKMIGDYRKKYGSVPAFDLQYA